METTTDWLFIIVMFIVLLGTVISLVLYIVNRNHSFSPKILAAVIFSVAYVLLGFGLGISNEYINYPHLYRTPVFLSICVSPLAYIYVRSVLEQQFRFKKWDFLFFVPALLMTMQFLPFYILPAEEKLKIITTQLTDKSIIAREPEGLLPEGWGLILRLLYNLGVTVATYLLLFRKKKQQQWAQQIEQNKEIYQWLFFLVTVLSASFFVLILETLFSISAFYDLYRIKAMTVSGTVIFMCFYLLLKPNILYGLKGWWQYAEHGTQAITPSLVLPVEEPKVAIKRKQTLTLAQGLEFKNRIDEHFATHKPFVTPGYTIGNLSEEVNIPTYQLSAFINQEYGKNFNEFINDQRVEHLKQFIYTTQDAQQFTLEALGQKVGFKSRTSFISAVKKNTGKTPSDYFGKKSE